MTTTDTHTDDVELYRNDPAEPHVAHLFEAGDVRSAGVTNGDHADHPVPPICSRRTSYGPFVRVPMGDLRMETLPGFDGDLCGVCDQSAARRVREADQAALDRETPPFNPADMTVDELESYLDDPREGGLHSREQLRALLAAERNSADRTTAVDAIRAALREVE